MKLFKRFFAKAKDPTKCSPSSPRGRHGIVLDGLGIFGDASICLRCGLDRYDDLGIIFLFHEERRQVRAPQDWPAISAARKLREKDER